MKGSNSRLNFDAEKRFSNVFHIQGGMITDADLAEASSIGLERDEALTRGAIHTGVPATGGMLDLSKGLAILQEGTVFAGGKQGHFRSTTKLTGADLPLEAMGAQVDYPNAPGAPSEASLVYADLWQRPVFALEDNGLTDAGLHGTETSYRAMTMVQIKSVPFKGETEAELRALFRDHPAFRKTGTAKIELKERAAEIEVDNCDPCADQVTGEVTLPNALWRLEVVSVERDGDGLPIKVYFAWSSENASRVEKNEVDIRDALKRDGAVYEFFSDTTEMHKGWFDNSVNVARSSFKKDFDAVPFSNEPDGFAYMRRWDGFAEVRKSGSTFSLGEHGSVERPTVSSNTLKINTPHFSIEMGLNNEDFLIGDYWLVELRRYAQKDEKLVLVGMDEHKQAAAMGPDHSHCPLLMADEDGPLEQQPNHLGRQVSFPNLADIPASHVAYDGKCPVYGGTETVEQALDAICNIQAEHIGFTPDPDCETLKDTNNVHDALNALCKADNDKALRLMLRTMMDWGVVCGIRLNLLDSRPDEIRLTGGTILDRVGNLQEFPSGKIDLNAIPGDRIHGDLADIQGKNGDVCLSVELVEDGPPLFHLSDGEFPYIQNDLPRELRVLDCLEGRISIDESPVLSDLDDEARILLNKIMTAWTNRDSMSSVIELSRSEHSQAQNILDQLVEEFSQNTSATYVSELEAVLNQADEEVGRLIANSGSAIGVRRLQHMVAKFGLLARIEVQSRDDCYCGAALPHCKTHDSDKPILVPIGCVTLRSFRPGNLAAREVCDLCCRKQAHTWHSWRYYFGDVMQNAMEEVKERCCNGAANTGSVETMLDEWNPTDEDLATNVGSEFWPPDPGVTNLTPRSGPDVRGLTVDAAAELLASAGVNVDHEREVHQDQGDVFGQIVNVLDADKTQPLNLDYQAKAGDTVALITSGRVVIDMFVTQQAPFYGYVNWGNLVKNLGTVGVFAPETPGRDPGVTDPPKDDIFRGEVQLQFEELLRMNETLAAEAQSAKDAVARLERDFGDFKSVADATVTTPGVSAGALRAVEDQLAFLVERNSVLENEAKAATDEVAAMRGSMSAMEARLIELTPIEDVVGKTNGARLAAKGITNVRMLDNASDTEVLSALGNNRRSLTLVRNNRNGFSIK